MFYHTGFYAFYSWVNFSFIIILSLTNNLFIIEFVQIFHFDKYISKTETSEHFGENFNFTKMLII